MPSKARMTIRFEPPVKPKQPPKPVVLPIVSENKKPSLNSELKIEQSLTGWNGPYQDDIHALEEIIRKTETVPESVQMDVTNDEQPQRRYTIEQLEDDEETHPEAEWLPHAVNVREDSPSWGRVLLSVAAAIGTGAIFGYIVLSLFTGEPLFPNKTGANAELPVQASVSQAPSAKSGSATEKEAALSSSAPNAAGTDEDAGTSTTVSPTQADVYYMLQYGVFKSETSMEAAVQQLQNSGLPYASEANEGYRVYVGIANSKDDAEQLAAHMPDTEVYVKAIGGERLEVSASVFPAAGVKFMDASAAFTRKLALLSAAGLQDNIPQPLGEAEWSALQQLHQQWLNTVSAAQKLNSEQTKDVGAIVKMLNSAMQSMVEFNRKPSLDHLRSVQTSVMQTLLVDRHMRAMLQSASDGEGGS